MVSKHLARRTGHCLGVDRAPEFLEIARAHAAPAEFLLLEAMDLDGLPERFDLVYARYFLSHQPDPEAR